MVTFSAKRLLGSSEQFSAFTKQRGWVTDMVLSDNYVLPVLLGPQSGASSCL